MQWQYNDGGRKAAGYKGEANDCVVRAIAIATERPYQEVYATLNDLAKNERIGTRKKRHSSSRDGVYKTTTARHLARLGWKWTPTMGIATGCTVHLKADELPSGRIIVSLSRHFAAVIDGILHDTYDGTRNGTRCVYGYWKHEV